MEAGNSKNTCVLTGRGEENGDQKEEEKMEKFFELIRSYREARNRRIKELMNDELEKKKQRAIKKRKSDGCGGGRGDAQQCASWVPSFEWEDFAKEAELGKRPVIFPAGPCHYNKKEHQTEGNREDTEVGLDLKLAL
ncbi:hypothetical protein RJ640_021688 [Escallonia rubra]|uniref:Uncharacterized protein n=1 Tax=Escallonia rubra TaxID=112253 RepID=A0AA88QIS7_9ASTE|nr:hypothetical protein RJ640_021688 [Escallonia rubra]